MLWLTRDTSRSRTSPGARRRGSRRMCRSHGAARPVAVAAFRKKRFRYDAGTDTYACPNGQQLKPLYISRVRDTTLMHYANRGACRGCALKVQCTSSSYRRIGRYADEAVLDRMAERLADRPGVLHLRRESAEHITQTSRVERGAKSFGCSPYSARPQGWSGSVPTSPGPAPQYSARSIHPTRRPLRDFGGSFVVVSPWSAP